MYPCLKKSILLMYTWLNCPFLFQGLLTFRAVTVYFLWEEWECFDLADGAFCRDLLENYSSLDSEGLTLLRLSCPPLKQKKEPWMVKRKEPLAKDLARIPDFGQEIETQRRTTRTMNASLGNAPKHSKTETVLWLLALPTSASQHGSVSVNIQGCDCGSLQGGMGMSRLCSEGIVHGCNVGELQQSSLCRKPKAMDLFQIKIHQV
ncbi:uncharacterized protein LOC128124468 isoform X5 [Peromyscus californicus insignis]|uniref:uncharacterized protein LOC128124468 isoform X5 n=1 Tax=Peromyscus californicus insignis TaxID=564181 RepID=UPI0022A6A6ED|nr:uncharacterized protein LOC128124468 isoform X5 [Peromyscus californicus insignis]